ncbi:hypothetical protein AU255_17425 [Methyloprofundus sedimenti]|uniref:Lnb N-terminal periplasmic domain-containing protein n=1 Tax=Methyloprofundus sedimenti TaxID=1420851 RepID=A0A1V8M175_9GAMM|nr:DUF4105 domain-containing protein [Methyloprofundus sedimenti]OQK15258.1 hypothetical protein AU255_17425 [Methyloprofundus sedimenti]
MLKILQFVFIATVITGATAWGACALYFGDSHTGTLQIFLAAGFAVSGLVALVGLYFPAVRYRLLAIHGVLFIAVLSNWLTTAPRNDRPWQQDVATLAYATFDDDRVTVHNIRNFSYRNEFDYQPAYYQQSYDLNKLEGADLFAIYWMGPAIAHTIMSFRFSDGKHLAFSIEARKEQNEAYSTIKGFFRQYELIYIVADERDVIGLRTTYRHDPPEQVYLYQLQGSKAEALRLLMAYLHEINSLSEHPVFYNTMTNNCTTGIWMHSLINPEPLPFSWKILLSGYVPQYLYESGKLDQRISFAELQRRAHINTRANDADNSVDFSQRIRKPL